MDDLCREKEDVMLIYDKRKRARGEVMVMVMEAGVVVYIIVILVAFHLLNLPPLALGCWTHLWCMCVCDCPCDGLSY